MSRHLPTALGLLALLSCGAPDGRAPAGSEPGSPARQGADSASGLPSAPDSLPPAPWSAEPLAPTQAPAALLRAWSRAENRDRCGMLAPDSIFPAGAAARTARFGGGWGVAWDLPDTRSAFGVAGTGVSVDEPAYDEWPHRLHWADGSHAGYGPEGGSGPKQLAYLEVVGQECLYNVWSRLGETHLEALLRSLRHVEPPPGGQPDPASP